MATDQFFSAQNMLLSNNLSESLSSFGFQPKKQVSMRDSAKAGAAGVQTKPTPPGSSMNVAALYGTGQVSAPPQASRQAQGAGSSAGPALGQSAPPGGPKATAASQHDPSMSSWFDQFGGGPQERSASASSTNLSPLDFFATSSAPHPTVSAPQTSANPLDDLLGGASSLDLNAGHPVASSPISTAPRRVSAPSSFTAFGPGSPVSSPPMGGAMRGPTAAPAVNVDSFAGLDGLSIGSPKTISMLSSSPKTTPMSPTFSGQAVRPVSSTAHGQPQPVVGFAAPTRTHRAPQGPSTGSSTSVPIPQQPTPVDLFAADPFDLSALSQPTLPVAPPAGKPAQGGSPHAPAVSHSSATASPFDDFLGLGDLTGDPLPSVGSAPVAHVAAPTPAPAAAAPVAPVGDSLLGDFFASTSPPPAASTTEPAAVATVADPADDFFGGLGSAPSPAAATDQSPASGASTDMDDFFGVSPSVAGSSTATKPAPARPSNDLDDLLGLSSSPKPQETAVPAPNRPAPVSDPIASLFNAQTGCFSPAAPPAAPPPVAYVGEAEDLGVSWGEEADIVSEEEGEEGEPEERKRLRALRIQKKRERISAVMEDKKRRELEEVRARDERAGCADRYGPQLKEWNDRNKGNIRAMLGSLENVLWEDAAWKPISMGSLISGGQVKKGYFKALTVVHPDKVKQRGGTVAQLYIADIVFDALKDAWGIYESTEK